MLYDSIQDKKRKLYILSDDYLDDSDFRENTRIESVAEFYSGGNKYILYKVNMAFSN